MLVCVHTVHTVSTHCSSTHVKSAFMLQVMIMYVRYIMCVYQCLHMCSFTHTIHAVSCTYCNTHTHTHTHTHTFQYSPSSQSWVLVSVHWEVGSQKQREIPRVQTSLWRSAMVHPTHEEQHSTDRLDKLMVK